MLKLSDKLENTDWAVVCEPPDPLIQLICMPNFSVNVYTNSCSSKACSKRFSKPWMTNGFCISIKRKNKVYRKFR